MKGATGMLLVFTGNTPHMGLSKGSELVSASARSHQSEAPRSCGQETESKYPGRPVTEASGRAIFIIRARSAAARGDPQGLHRRLCGSGGRTPSSGCTRTGIRPSLTRAFLLTEPGGEAPHPDAWIFPDSEAGAVRSQHLPENHKSKTEAQRCLQKRCHVLWRPTVCAS